MTLPRVMCGKSLSLTLAGLLFLSLKSVLADPAAGFDYQIFSYYEAGQATGCDLYITAMNAEGQFVAANLTIFVEPEDPDTYAIYTALRVRSTRADRSSIEKYLLGQRDLNFQTTPLNINYAWISTSTGTTVNNVKTAQTGPVFLAGTSDLDLFTNLLPGLLESGVTVGVQELEGTLDTVFEIAEPPSIDDLGKLRKCTEDIINSMDSLQERGNKAD